MKDLFGYTIRDKVTGLTGVLTGYVTYITGSDQVLLSPRVESSFPLEDARWVDVARVELVDTVPPIFLSDKGLAEG